MKYTIASLVIMITLLGISCQRKTPVADSSKATGIIGKEWRLTTWSNQDINPADYTVTANFTAEFISGKSAVNQYNGPYTISKNFDFSVGQVIMTRMAGTPDEMKVEQIYHELLGKVKRYSLDNSGLALFDENKNQLLFFIYNK